MRTKISISDIGVLKDSWAMVRKATIKILKDNLKEKIEVSSLIPMSFDDSLILGHGKWGLVIGLPSIEEIVLKITTDPFEFYLIEMLRHDEELRHHDAVPILLGSTILNMNGDTKNPMYLIVRENLNPGVPLGSSNPLVRMKDSLIDNFIVPMEKIENEIARTMNKRKNLSMIDVSVVYSMMSGHIKKQVSKMKIKLPKVASSSSISNVIDLQKKLLDKGIALVDIHPNNLAYREFDLSPLFKDVKKRDMSKVVVSDLGMAYGTPIFLESGMAYKGLDDMISHFSTILKDYTYTKSNSKDTRKNPEIDYAFIVEDIKDCCKESTSKNTNIFVDVAFQEMIDKIVDYIILFMPKIHISRESIKIALKNEIILEIASWMMLDDVIEEKEDCYIIRCHIIEATNSGTYKCKMLKDLNIADDCPIGEFKIPKSYEGIESLINPLVFKTKRNASFDYSTQYIPIQYTLKINGVQHDSY